MPTGSGASRRHIGECLGVAVEWPRRSQISPPVGLSIDPISIACQNVRRRPGRVPGPLSKGEEGPVSRSAYLFTSESVSEGHPDKVCDRISDTVVDAYLGAMPEARVACETLATTNRVVIAGEVRGPASILDKVEGLTRDAIRDIGYEQDGFHWKTAAV